MSGFDNDVMYAKNADFTSADNQNVSELNGLVTNGKLWIGSTSTNVGGTHINVGSLTSPNSSITFGYSSPDITMIVNPSTVGQTITGNSGGALSPTGGNWNILGSGSITTSGIGSTLTIAASGGGLSWVDVTGTSATMVVNTGYVSDNAALVTLTLPSTASFGSVIRVVGRGAGGWKVVLNSGQQIILGITQTTVTTGSLSASNRNDCIEMLCTVANTTFTVMSSMGNILVL